MVLNRVWQPGDRIEIDLPLAISTAPLPGSDRYLAILYGPIVLSGALGRADLAKTKFWEIKTTVPDDTPPEDQFPQLGKIAHEVEASVTRSSIDSLEFRFTAASMPIKLIPFYQNHYQRYAIYWRAV